MLQRRIDAVERTVCLALDGSEFIALASDNVMMAHGLFRMMLGPAGAVLWNGPPGRPGRTTAGPLHAVDKVLLLGQHPLFAKATAAQLVDLAAIARELPFVAGQRLFGAEDPPAIYHIVSGALRLDADGAEPVAAGPGHHWRGGRAERRIMELAGDCHRRRTCPLPRSRGTAGGAPRRRRPAADGHRRSPRGGTPRGAAPIA